MKATVLKISMKITAAVFLLLAGITAQAALPQGKWVVEQVSIEKNTDGKIENKVYKSAAEVKGYIPCPQEWEINAQSIVIRYSDGWEEVSPLYIEKDNRLTMQIADGSMQTYQIHADGGNLTLITSYSYVNNLPAGQVERIEEKRTIILKKLS